MTHRALKLLAGRAISAIVGVATLVGIVYGLITFIDSRVERALQDEAILHKISSRVRPSLIMDSKAAVLVDLGAMDYILEIKVIHRPNPESDKILLRPKQYFAHAPLLSPVGNFQVTYTAERASGIDWEFTILETIDPGSQFGTPSERSYRIEILN